MMSWEMPEERMVPLLGFGGSKVDKKVLPQHSRCVVVDEWYL
jgi:hypothetical protein